MALKGVLPFDDADAVVAAGIEGRDDDDVVAVGERDVAVAAVGVRDDNDAVAVAAGRVRDDDAVAVAAVGVRDDDAVVTFAAAGVRGDDDAVAVDAVGVRGDGDAVAVVGLAMPVFAAVVAVGACVDVGGVDGADADAAVDAGDQWPVARARCRGVHGPRHADDALRRG